MSAFYDVGKFDMTQIKKKMYTVILTYQDTWIHY